MPSRTLRLGATVLTAVALVACNKPADTPRNDSTAAANATPSVNTPADTAVKLDTTTLKTPIDSTKLPPDSAKPVKK